MSFQAFQLRAVVRRDQPILDGRTLSGSVPCQLLHHVSVCKPTPAIGDNGVSRNLNVSTRVRDLIDLLNVTPPTLDCSPRGEYCALPRLTASRLLSDTDAEALVTRVPHRYPWRSFADVYVGIIEAGLPFEQFWERPKVSAPPNIFGPTRPPMPFIPTAVTFNGVLKSGSTRTLKSGLRITKRGRIKVTDTNGELTGKSFVQGKHGYGCAFVYKGKTTVRPSRKEQAQWHKAVRSAEFITTSGGGLPCVFCRENSISTEEFLLCGECAAAHSAPVRHYFEAVGNIAEYTFEDEPGFLASKHDQTGTAVIDGEDLRFAEGMPRRAKADADVFEKRPLGEFELAIILGGKFKGLTTNPKHFAKAQRAAFQLVGHYIGGYSFDQIAKMLGSSRDAVAKFCTRARQDSEKNLRFTDEAMHVVESGLLRTLYPPEATVGHRCYSRTCCTQHPHFQLDEQTAKPE